MSFTLITLMARLPQLAAVLGAIYLASQGKDGWGWLIFLTLVMDCSIEMKAD